MTTTQQTKIAELLINKLNAAHNQAFEEILPPTVLQNQIQQKMVMAGVVYEMMERAYMQGYFSDFYNFDNFLNNITHE
jgi:hypothetical protein